jgi:hypothetical protein
MQLLPSSITPHPKKEKKFDDTLYAFGKSVHEPTLIRDIMPIKEL